MADVPEMAARLFLRVVFEFAFYFTGKALLYVVSLGRLRTEPFYAAPKPGQRRVGRQPDGTVVVGGATTYLIGMLALLAAFVMIVLIWRQFFIGCPSGIVGPDGSCIY